MEPSMQSARSRAGDSHLATVSQGEGYRVSVHPDDVARALDRVSPDCSQGTWWRVAAAIYDGLGDEGFDLFDEEGWSRSAKKYPGRRGCQYQWRFSKRYSKRGGGGANGRPITIATLFWFAKGNDCF